MPGERENGFSQNEKIQITNINLDRLDRQFSALHEMKEAFLAEKIRIMLSELSGEYEGEVFERLIREENFPERFREITERSVHTEDSEAPIGNERLFALDNMLEQMEICRRLAHAGDEKYRLRDRSRGDVWARMIGDLVKEDVHQEDEMIPDLDVRTPRPKSERIAYLKNTYTDMAYERFAEILPGCTCSYYSDFPGVCEALYYGNASACILPLENSADGKLVRFYGLIGKYDLRISMAAEITADDTDVTTKYVLLRKNITVPKPDVNFNFGTLFCECTVILEEGISLSGILLAASVYGLELTRVDVDPISYAEAEDSYDIIFRVGNGDLQAMLTYLYAMAPQFTLLGIYTTV